LPYVFYAGMYLCICLTNLKDFLVRVWRIIFINRLLTHFGVQTSSNFKKYLTKNTCQNWPNSKWIYLRRKVFKLAFSQLVLTGRSAIFTITYFIYFFVRYFWKLLDVCTPKCVSNQLIKIILTYFKGVILSVQIHVYNKYINICVCMYVLFLLISKVLYWVSRYMCIVNI